MNAASLAKLLKAEEAAKAEKEKAETKRISTARDKAKLKMISWIEEALGSFEMVVTKKWFAGCDYWDLSKGDRVLCSCVLYFETGTYDASDDCRGLPYANWFISVYNHSWAGPHDKDATMSGIGCQESLNKYVAQIMVKHV